MAIANYKCDCGATVSVSFRPGEKFEAPVCEKCGKAMTRIFGKVGIGDVMPQEFVSISRMMSYHKK